MSEPAKTQTIQLVSEVPFDSDVITYTRFLTNYEAAEYTGWVDESVSWKKTCYIGDWSPLLKILVSGPDALRFFSDISVNSFAKFDIGQAKHVIFCNAEGMVMGEGVLMRQADDRFLFTSGTGVPWAIYQFSHAGRRYDAQLVNLTDRQFIFQLQGPSALFVLEKAMNESVRDIGFMRFRSGAIQGMPIDILRQGMAGELGYELHGSGAHAVQIYQCLLSAGEAFGIRRLGGRTKLVNHVEACFPTPTIDYAPAFEGAPEFHAWFASRRNVGPLKFFQNHRGSAALNSPRDLHRNPYELGWGRNVKFDHAFIGREALERMAQGSTRRMVTLVWNSEDVLDVHASLFRQDEQPYQPMELPREYLGTFQSDRVEVDGRVVGATSSRCYSYHFRQMLSLCVIDEAHAQEGTPVNVVWGAKGQREKVIRAVVAPAPYKKDNRRLDVTALPSYL